MQSNTLQHLNRNTYIHTTPNHTTNPLFNLPSYNISKDIYTPITLQQQTYTSTNNNNNTNTNNNDNNNNTSIFWAKLKLTQFLQNLISTYNTSFHTNKYNFDLNEMYKIQTITEFNSKYILGSIIGRGGDGTVHVDANNNNIVIKKVVIHNFDQDIFDKLFQSLQELYVLNNTSIIKLHGLYYDYINNIIYKVYDKFDSDLTNIISKLNKYNVGLTEIQTLQLIKILANKIKKLHSNNYIHCDIKPDNILFGNNTWNIIDFDRIKFNVNNKKIYSKFCGTLGFSAPELQHHGGPLLNIIDNSIDIWSLGLIIIWCINGGHLGYLEINNNLREKYNLAAEQHNINTMTEIFNKYYYRLYIENDGNNYLKEIYRLYNDQKISLNLYNLLHKMLNKNPINRINIFDMLNDEWFKMDNNNENNSNDMIWINGEYINFYSALLHNNYSNYAVNIQQNKLSNNNICQSLEYNMSQSPMNSTELLNGSTSYIPIENETKAQEMPTDNNIITKSNINSSEILDLGLDLNNLYISLSSEHVQYEQFECNDNEIVPESDIRYDDTPEMLFGSQYNDLKYGYDSSDNNNNNETDLNGHTIGSDSKEIKEQIDKEIAIYWEW